MEDGIEDQRAARPDRSSERQVTMFQTVYTNVKRGFSQEVTPPAEFMRQYNGACEQFPLMEYCIDMGIKQAIPDAMSGVTDEAVFCAKILKKADAVFTGTVRVAGSGERQPTKTPIEREVWKIAAADLAKTFEKLKTPKNNQATYIRMKIERDWAELEPRARENLAKVEAIKPASFAALDELYAAAEAAAAEVPIEVEAEPQVEVTAKRRRA
jgi:hypothetical protein